MVGQQGCQRVGAGDAQREDLAHEQHQVEARGADVGKQLATGICKRRGAVRGRGGIAAGMAVSRWRRLVRHDRFGESIRFQVVIRHCANTANQLRGLCFSCFFSPPRLAFGFRVLGI